ncbi:hypothetical protein VHUM_01579 [Vanrija humicola]|uniref:Enoyl reductase (ER) domain-containing protein n=1 Tax=Vanrija humicola TaxID=5417 RepID=A0A7D8V407_VANHU|nr:hypothetical protein VHUM_01579 [Vanrija humicola]
MALADLPRPTPGADEILVAVHAGALNPIDEYLRSGLMAPITPLAFPQVAGNELSGRVVALGAGVRSFAVGDAVVARVGKLRTGTLAQLVAVPVAYAAHAPTTVPLSDAAGLPLCGLTAVQMLDRLKVGRGDRLLIAGGATAVGLFGIQLAKLRGAHVVATASPAGAPLVRAMGADEVIDYKASATAVADWAAAHGAFGKVFDAAGPREDVSQLVAAATDAAHIVTVAGPLPPGCFDAVLPMWRRWYVNTVLWTRFRGTRALVAARGISYEYVFMEPDGAQLAQLVKLVDDGQLKLTTDGEYPLERWAEAFARLESGRAKGKIVITLPPLAGEGAGR